MSWTAFFLIVTSATFHATWNLLAKKSHITLPFYTILCTICAILWCHTQFWTPVKVFALPPLFWLMLAGSIASDLVYCFGIVHAYKVMEMSTAYPMMRSLPLLFTALLTCIFGWGKPLTFLSVLGMTIVFAGCVMMPLARFSDFSIKSYANRNILFILLVACGTTGYTIFDSQAQKVMASVLTDVSKLAFSITYYSIRTLVLTATCWTCVLLSREARACLKDYWKNRCLTPIYAGCIASLCYVLVLLSMNYVSNVSYVQVFRQIGLVVGVAAGILILKEQCNFPKIVGVSLIIIGLIITVL